MKRENSDRRAEADDDLEWLFDDGGGPQAREDFVRRESAPIRDIALEKQSVEITRLEARLIVEYWLKKARHMDFFVTWVGCFGRSDLRHITHAVGRVNDIINTGLVSAREAEAMAERVRGEMPDPTPEQQERIEEFCTDPPGCESRIYGAPAQDPEFPL